MNRIHTPQRLQHAPLRWLLPAVGTALLIFTSIIHPRGKFPLVVNAVADTLLVDSLTGWPRPRFEERKRERLHMVATQMTGVNDVRVLDAMRQVPRHLFVPEMMRPYAYEDGPLPIGEGQTISQPFIVASMTEAADIRAGEKVLEIGTGSGYQAAVLSELTPEIFTIEIVKPLAEQAAATFRELGYSTIRTRIGDGYAGWPEEAPFDAIIVTAAPEQIPETLVRQLASGGRLIVPVGESRKTQHLVRLIKNDDGTVVQDTLFRVRFVPMIHGR
ncbi:MAG: protein-L-isoaspartate(D-aspartate) O-methyltransferase [bacterium]